MFSWQNLGQVGILQKKRRGTTPKIYALCVTKDEEDIIGFCLQHASQFCGKIFVLDNGSEDKTWEIVKSLSEINPSVVPVERKACQFGRGLRGYLFNKMRSLFREGDWIMILDSDEFLEEDPRDCISFCESHGYDCIDFLQAQFYPTNYDIKKQGFKNPNLHFRSFAELPQHYKLNWKEVRLFRYRHGLEWPDFADDGKPTQITLPLGLKKKCPKFLVNRHYQYRSYYQINHRLKIRSDVFKRTGRFPHNIDTDWKKYVRKRKKLRHAPHGYSISYSHYDKIYVTALLIYRKLSKYVKFGKKVL